MIRFALFVALFPSLLEAQGVVVQGERKSTRVLYGRDAERPAEICLHYGSAEWRGGHASELGKKSEAHFRLGTGFWATLHTSVELTLGEKKVPPNTWYLGLHRSADAIWSLTLMDSTKVARSGKTSGSTRDVKPDVRVPVLLKDVEDSRKDLSIRFELHRGRFGHGSLNLHWGKHAVEIPFHAAVVEKQPEGEPKFAKLDPKRTVTTESGLQFEELHPGIGASPKVTDRVEVRYVGWSEDGSRFDSSFLNDKTATFPLARLIKGWQEGLRRMKPGAVFRMRIPPDLAYGERGGGPIGPNATISFWVELVAIR